jgi:hypothetical protein
MAKPDPADKLLDELLKGKKPEEILGEEGLRDAPCPSRSGPRHRYATNGACEYFDDDEICSPIAAA